MLPRIKCANRKPELIFISEENIAVKLKKKKFYNLGLYKIMTEIIMYVCLKLYVDLLQQIILITCIFFFI